MSNALRDGNDVPTWLGLSCVDGVTPVPIKVNSSNGGVECDFTSVTSFTPAPSTKRDDNQVPIKTGISTTSATTILPVYVNPTTGGILMET